MFLSDTTTIFNQVQVDLQGGLNLNLPLSFPDPATSIGALTFAAPSLAELFKGTLPM